MHRDRPRIFRVDISKSSSLNNVFFYADKRAKHAKSNQVPILACMVDMTLRIYIVSRMLHDTITTEVRVSYEYLT